VTQWWTYTLGDFLMFSPATYWRLVDNYNRDVWPVQLAGLVAGFAAFGLLLCRQASTARVQALLLAAAFLWVGWAFFWQRYATINWAANYFAFAFWVQAAMLVVLAWLPTRNAIGQTDSTQKIGWVLALAGMVIPSLACATGGKPANPLEVFAVFGVFGIMPEPTALVCLGLLFARPVQAPPSFRWALTIIPLASLLVSAATLRAMAQS